MMTLGFGGMFRPYFKLFKHLIEFQFRNRLSIIVLRSCSTNAFELNCLGIRISENYPTRFSKHPKHVRQHMLSIFDKEVNSCFERSLKIVQ